MVPFESFGTVFYSHSIVTMALSYIISETKQDICGKSRFCNAPSFVAPLDVSPSQYCYTAWCGKTRMVGLYPTVK